MINHSNQLLPVRDVGNQTFNKMIWKNKNIVYFYMRESKARVA